MLPTNRYYLPKQIIVDTTEYLLLAPKSHRAVYKKKNRTKNARKINDNFQPRRPHNINCTESLYPRLDATCSIANSLKVVLECTL